MKIIIDISKYIYNSACVLADLDGSPILKAIKNGTPLPKSHGRLIDADELQRRYCDDNCGQRKCVDAMDRCVFIDAVLESHTIIEADTKRSKDEN